MHYSRGLVYKDPKFISIGKAKTYTLLVEGDEESKSGGDVK